MKVNTEKMLDEQAKQNEKIANTEPVREDIETVCYVEKPMPTKTNMVETADSVLMTRYMYNHIYRIEFAKDVKVVDVLEYMDIDDGTFIKCAKRFN